MLYRAPQTENSYQAKIAEFTRLNQSAQVIMPIEGGVGCSENPPKKKLSFLIHFFVTEDMSKILQ